MNPNGVTFTRSESPQIEYNVSGSTMQLSIMHQYIDSGSAQSGSRRQCVVVGGVTPVVAGSYENASPVAAGSSAPMLNSQGIPFRVHICLIPTGNSLHLICRLELNAVTEEMLRLDPLLPLREAAKLTFLKNRHLFKTCSVTDWLL